MEFAFPKPLFFDRRAATSGEKQADVHAIDEARKEKRLFCALCRHAITREDERIPVNGSHEHTCTNPAGYTFGIGCFREAAGCVAAGPATEAHTWFKGYAWRMAICASCEHHLGWRFEASTDYFHGLILNRLTAIGRASK